MGRRVGHRHEPQCAAAASPSLLVDFLTCADSLHRRMSFSGHPLIMTSPPCPRHSVLPRSPFQREPRRMGRWVRHRYEQQCAGPPRIPLPPGLGRRPASRRPRPPTTHPPVQCSTAPRWPPSNRGTRPAKTPPACTSRAAPAALSRAAAPPVAASTAAAVGPATRTRPAGPGSAPAPTVGPARAASSTAPAQAAAGRAAAALAATPAHTAPSPPARKTHGMNLMCTGGRVAGVIDTGHQMESD